MRRDLSPVERSMWLAHAFLGDPRSLHLAMAVSVDLVLSFDEARRRLQRAAAGVGLLDLAIDTTDGVPSVVQVLRDPGWVVELGADQGLERQVDGFVSAAFDLGHPPLFRAGWRTGPSGGGVLVLVAHHILFDGRSFEHLAKILIAELGGSPPVERWPVLDPAFVPWQVADEAWTERLIPLPDHGTAVGLLTGGPGATGRVLMSGDAVSRLDAVQALTGSSRATILLALFAAALHRVLDLDDLLVVTQLDVRPTNEGRSLGMLVNTLPVRSSLARDVEWPNFLEQIQSQLHFALVHRREPFDDIVRNTRPARRSDGSSVFSDFEFSYLRERPDPRVGTFAARILPRPDPASRYGESMNVVDRGDEIEVRWGSRSADARLHHLLQSAVEALLQGMADGTGSPTSSDVVPPDERADIFALGTGPSRPLDVVPPTAYLRAVSESEPDRLAVVHADERCTFRGLDSRAASVCALLSEHGVARGDRVLVSCRRGVAHVAVATAILHLGAVYVPCDPGNPPERAVAMAADARPKVVLVDETISAALRAALGEVVGEVLEVPNSQHGEARLLEPTVAPVALDPVYVLFTSGSTGRPKGVEVGLAAFLNHLEMVREHLDLRPGEAVAQTAPLGFDVHVWQALVPLVGATAVVFETELRDPEELLAGVERHGVSILELVPSYLRATCDLLDTRPEVVSRTAAVRHLLTTGEALEPALLPRLRAAFPYATITNAYGPAEAADDVALQVLDDGPVVPIGHPARNVELLVVDRWQRVRPLGLPGELLICGPVLANGYVVEGRTVPFGEHPYRRGERGYATGDVVTLTREMGLLFHGRVDDQVKLAGRRVELGEIEAALLSVPGVRDAAVLLTVGDAPARGRLHALAVLADGVEVEEVRLRLVQLVPDFMVPRHVQQVTAIPRSANGKLDRDAARLLSTPGDASDDEPNRDEVFEAVRRAWVAVLGQEATEQNFFAVGGDSLGAVDLAARLGAAGWAFSVRDLYQHQTVPDLVGLLTRRVLESEAPTTISFSPTPRQLHMIGTADQVVPPPVLAVVFDDVVDVARIIEAVRQVVREGAALRVAVRRQDGGTRIVEQPVSDVVVPSTVPVISMHGAGSIDDRLVAAAAGSIDPAAGRLVGASVHGSTVCVAVSHLMGDVHALAELKAALSEALAGRPTRLSTGMAEWSSELHRRAPAAVRTYAAHLARVRRATEHQLQRAPTRSTPVVTEHGRAPLPGLDGLSIDLVQRVVLGLMARMLVLRTGLVEVRVDLESDGRGTLTGASILGTGVGCHTLLEPVLLHPRSLEPEALLDSVDHALATKPPAWSWDAALLADRSTVEGDLPSVPLVNVLGRSFSTRPHPALARARVPNAVAAWNAASDEHGLVVDVIEREPWAGWHAEVTRRPGGWPWDLSDVLTELEAFAPTLAEVIRRPRPPLPRGLHLLGLEGDDVAPLLDALERDPR